MKIVILCGGLGYRLKEETEFKPKPMVLIGGKPMLWHIMKIYSYYGFNDFIIALGYKGDYIKEYFLNQKYFLNDFKLHTRTGSAKIYKNGDSSLIDDFKITFVNTGQETLPGERIFKLKKYIDEDPDKNFMVTYGDGVSNVNIKELVKFHTKQKTIGTILGVHPHSKYGLIRINKEGVISRFVEKPILNEWVNGGFMVFKKAALKYFGANEMEHEGLKRLISKKQLSLFVHEGFWQAMDTYNDVDALNKLWFDTAPWKVWK